MLARDRSLSLFFSEPVGVPRIMVMNEKYDCIECARINDHEAVKGFYNPPNWVLSRYSDRLLALLSHMHVRESPVLRSHGAPNAPPLGAPHLRWLFPSPNM